MKIKNKAEIKKILFITLSNIGDIILTTPALSVLKNEFPRARIDVVSGPNGKEIFSGHPFVSELILYDKFSDLKLKVGLIRRLKKNRYDLIVDLRNSMFPFLIGSRYRTPVRRPPHKNIKHKKDQHLWKLKQLGLNVEAAPFSFYVDAKDEILVNELLSDLDVKKDFVVVAPGAKSHIKRWTKEGLASVCDKLIGESGLSVIMAGDKDDSSIIEDIASLMKNRALDLSSRLTLRQFGALLKKAKLLITNDSAPMHVSHALGVKTLAIFGPTDPDKYGPRGKYDVVIRKELACAPCEVAQCKKHHECMSLINAAEVFGAIRRMLSK